jgi:anti-sigma B factor antagonist
MATLSVSIHQAPEAVIIRLEGEAGINAADSVQVAFQRISGTRPPLVVLDMTELCFVASLFLGFLVNFRRGLVSRGCRIQIAGARPSIREVLQVTRLEELFEFVALAPLGSEEPPTPPAG